MIVEIGAGERPDDRTDIATDIRESAAVDCVLDAEAEWPFVDDSADGVIAHHVLEHLERPEAAFREAARVLQPGGWLEVRVPVGANVSSDPTHTRAWNWRTPLFFSRQSPRDYFDLPFALTSRQFTDIALVGPGRPFSTVVRAAAQRAPGKWVTATPWLCGELAAHYRREAR